MPVRIALAALAALLSCSGPPRPPEPERTAQPVNPTPPPADPRPVIVAFGDSLTDGHGVASGEKYTDFLQQLLDKQGLQYRVVNAGVSGDTTANALDRLSSVTALHPTLVILEIGGNDGLRGLPIEQTRRNLEEILQALRSQGAKVVLWGMTLPKNYGPKYIAEFERVFAQAAATHQATLLSVREFGKVEMQADGIHPTGAGYRAIAPVVFKYLRRELPATP